MCISDLSSDLCSSDLVEQLEALSLAPGFTIEDMLSSRNPELYYQVNNCMSMMLSDDHRMGDSGCEVFWNIEGVSGILDRALFNLRKMEDRKSTRLNSRH